MEYNPVPERSYQWCVMRVLCMIVQEAHGCVCSNTVFLTKQVIFSLVMPLVSLLVRVAVLFLRLMHKIVNLMPVDSGVFVVQWAWRHDNLMPFEVDVFVSFALPQDIRYMPDTTRLVDASKMRLYVLFHRLSGISSVCYCCWSGLLQ